MAWLCLCSNFVSSSSRPAETLNGAHLNAQDAFLLYNEGLARQNLDMLAKSFQPHLCVRIARLQLLTTVYLTVSTAPWKSGNVCAQKSLRGVKH